MQQVSRKMGSNKLFSCVSDDIIVFALARLIINSLGHDGNSMSRQGPPAKGTIHLDIPRRFSFS